MDAIAGGFRDGERVDQSRLDVLPAGTRVWVLPLRDPLPLRVALATKRRLRNGHGRASTTHGEADQLMAPVRAETGTERLRRNLRARLFEWRWAMWVDAAARVGAGIGRLGAPGLVFSSGPPHDCHLAAMRVARGLGRPWVADFRDPWLEVERLERGDRAGSRRLRRVADRERRICEHASLVVLNTRPAMHAFQARYPALGSRMITVWNGADPEVRSFTGPPGDRFTISHAGELYLGRDPRPLMRGVREFLRRRPDAVGDTRVHFVGSTAFDGIPLEAIARDEGVGDAFTCEPAVPRAQALSLSGRAAVNVVLQQDPAYSAVAVPAKVYDLIQFPGTLLVLGRPGDAARDLLSGTVAGFADADDPGSIAAILEGAWLRWRRGERPAALNDQGQFDRERQMRLLFDELERLAQG